MDSAVGSLNERRASARSVAPCHDVAFARVRPGHAVAVINISSTGAFLETGRRLLPGTDIDLQVQRHGAHASMRSRVLRCAVVAVAADGVSYRAGVRFAQPLAWFTIAAEAGRTVPDNEGHKYPGRWA